MSGSSDGGPRDPHLVAPQDIETPAQALAFAKYLEPCLGQQRLTAEFYDAHYNGWALPESCWRDYAEVFGQADNGGLNLEPPRANVCRIGIDALSERLRVDGFRSAGPLGTDKDPAADEAWAVWIENDMDVMSAIGHTESMVKATGAVLVEPGLNGKAVISIEDATQMVLHRSPAPPYGVDAALKVGWDEWTGDTVSWLWTPAGKWSLRKRTGQSSWEATDGPVPYQGVPAGTLPIVELAQRQRLLLPPQSELSDVAPLADMLNFVLAQMGIAVSFGAVPVRTATGIRLPRLRDANGDLLLDAAGRERIDPDAEPMDVRADRALVSEDPEAKFGVLPGADLTGYASALSQLMGSIRGQTGVPQHYYEGAPAGTSSETLIAAEANLVRRANRAHDPFGQAWRRAIRLALLIDGSSYANAPLLVRWKDTDSRSMQQDVANLSAFVAAGGPIQAALSEFLHWDPATIDRTMSLARANDATAQAMLDTARQQVQAGRTVSVAPLQQAA